MPRPQTLVGDRALEPEGEDGLDVKAKYVINFILD